MAADAITGLPSAANAADVDLVGPTGVGTSAYVAGTTLFDESGSSLLVVSGGTSIDLFAPREKLRGGGFGGWIANGGGAGISVGVGGGNGAGAGGALIPDAIVAGLGSGVSSSTIGNVSFSAGGAGVGSSSVTTAPIAAPEPPSLVLLASGIALAARRLARARRQRRAR